jgi:AraC-like DNA-binding protein
MSSEIQVANRHTIANYFARTHLANATLLGAQEQQVLFNTGLTPAQLTQPQGRVLATQLAAIVNNCWRITGDELLGFTQQKLKLGVFKLLAQHLITCKTLEDVLLYMQSFYQLIGEQLSVKIHREGTQLRLSIDPNFAVHNHSHPAKSLLVELLLLICHRFSSWLLGQVIPLKKVCLQYAQPYHYEEYRLMFACPCEYLSTNNSLVFDLKYLALPVVQNAEDLARYLQQIPLPWFKKQSFHGTFSTQVMVLLEQALDLESLSAKLNMTPRTLRRKLTEEGSGFQQLKDNVRRDKAIHLFEQAHLTIAEIGLLVGFTEPATFSRTFKRWTGVSPSTYRNYQSP